MDCERCTNDKHILYIFIHLRGISAALDEDCVISVIATRTSFDNRFYLKFMFINNKP